MAINAGEIWEEVCGRVESELWDVSSPYFDSIDSNVVFRKKNSSGIEYFSSNFWIDFPGNFPHRNIKFRYSLLRNNFLLRIHGPKDDLSTVDSRKFNKGIKLFTDKIRTITTSPGFDIFEALIYPSEKNKDIFVYALDMNIIEYKLVLDSFFFTKENIDWKNRCMDLKVPSCIAPDLIDEEGFGDNKFFLLETIIFTENGALISREIDYKTSSLKIENQLELNNYRARKPFV